MCVCNNVVSALLIIVIIIIIIACFPMKVLKNETKKCDALRIYRSRSRKTRRRWHFRKKRVQKFIVYRFVSFQQGNDFCIPVVIIPEVRKQIFESSNNLCKQQNNQIEYIYTGRKCLTFFENKTKTSQIWRFQKQKNL